MTPTRPPGRVETLNGQRLYFEAHGTGEPLLLLHGFSGSSQDWIPSPAQARAIMSQYGDNLPQEQWDILRRRHPGGDVQIKAILANTKSFASSYDDLNFTPPLLSTIKARTFIIQGDRDPLYPVELSVEMYQAIPNAHVWIVPNAGHGPVIGNRWPEFIQSASAFLLE